jgi:hypothetical protein
MVFFSLHGLKEFPYSALKMMTRDIFRTLQTHSRRHAIAIRAALTVPFYAASGFSARKQESQMKKKIKGIQSYSLPIF